MLTFRFVIFWRKEIGAKAARKLLVKLIPDGQFESNCENYWLRGLRFSETELDLRFVGIVLEVCYLLHTQTKVKLILNVLSNPTDQLFSPNVLFS